MLNISEPFYLSVARATSPMISAGLRSFPLVRCVFHWKNELVCGQLSGVLGQTEVFPDTTLTPPFVPIRQQQTGEKGHAAASTYTEIYWTRLVDLTIISSFCCCSRVRFVTPARVARPGSQ
ncbi:hypothetical protein AcV7_001806 [Taiwanofungus camphoratus]|nr:hypothetical protein AcV7_001806 [Antrodia cinnamomea]